MTRSPRIPAKLRHEPFSLRDASAAGITLAVLRGKAWRRLATGLYCRSDLPADNWKLLAAWQHLLPPDSAFSGATAAWLFGLDFNPSDPVEVTVSPGTGVRSRVGLAVRHCATEPSEIVEIRGLRATSIHRTLRDVYNRFPAVEALVAIDGALRRGLIDRPSLIAPRRLRLLAEFAEPAESPMETRLRWLLIQAGLPRPEVQKDLRDVDGRFLGRADLYYSSARLVIEYDGANHRDRLVEDNRRQNLLLNAGFRLLRFTAADIHQRPEVVTALVRQALK